MSKDTNKHCIYSLRKHPPAQEFSPFSKLNEELRNNDMPKCPPIMRKRSMTPLFIVKRFQAKPVGEKGKLSPHYDVKLNRMYLDQLFVEVDSLGAGSFGCVHKYRSLEDGKYYAIKIVKRSSTEDRYAEVYNLDRISDNPYCIQYVNAWDEDGVLYIQFELALTSLGNYARKNHNITESECWDILHDILLALVPLHAKGLCHMDIKPDNILITEDGKYKLCDFDLLTEISKVDPNKYSMCEGDAKYIASEVLQGHAAAPGDIFSLGISILELSMDLLLPVSGHRWINLRDNNWRLKHHNNRAISQDLEGLLNWMMTCYPEQRPTSRQLMKLPMIMKLHRSKKPRVNSYAIWCAENEEEEDPEEMVPVILMHTPPNTPRRMPDTNSPRRTPMRRVSSIKLRKSALSFMDSSSNGANSSRDAAN